MKYNDIKLVESRTVQEMVNSLVKFFERDCLDVNRVNNSLTSTRRYLEKYRDSAPAIINMLRSNKSHKVMGNLLAATVYPIQINNKGYSMPAYSADMCKKGHNGNSATDGNGIAQDGNSNSNSNSNGNSNGNSIGRVPSLNMNTNMNSNQNQNHIGNNNNSNYNNGNSNGNGSSYNTPRTGTDSTSWSPRTDESNGSDGPNQGHRYVHNNINNTNNSNSHNHNNQHHSRDQNYQQSREREDLRSRYANNANPNQNLNNPNNANNPNSRREKDPRDGRERKDKKNGGRNSSSSRNTNHNQNPNYRNSPHDSPRDSPHDSPRDNSVQGTSQGPINGSNGSHGPLGSERDTFSRVAYVPNPGKPNPFKSEYEKEKIRADNR